MVFDPGTNTWGMAFGSGFGGNRSSMPNFGGGGLGRLPRPMMNNISGTSGGWGDWGMGVAQNQANAAGAALKQGEDLWQQQLQERTMGLQNKYDLQRLQMQLQAQRENAMMQLYAQGMALPSEQQIERSRGDLAPSRANYQRYADEGRYNDAEMNTLSQNAWNQINEGAMNNARSFNSQLSSMGLGSNPGAAQALGLAGRFAANAQRGNVMSDLIRQNEEAKQWGTTGLAGIDSQLADYASRPVNRLANFDPFGLLGGNMDERKKKAAGNQMSYGNSQPWKPTAGAY